MRRTTLIACAVLCVALALSPLVPWAWADATDRSLTALEVTVPVALGLAAVLLAVHGLVLQRQLVASLEEDFPHPFPAPPGASERGGHQAVGAGTGTVVAGTAAAADRPQDAPGPVQEAAEEPETTAEAGGGERGTKAKKKAGAAGKRAGMRVAQRAKSRAGGAARRSVRSVWSSLRPKR